ncbi:MAG: type VI secretion system baseplate subunit TssG [Polyangiaceae bacterium]|nr:type VI secretion system baseplate subunit TssG [Polyangiaceae bacterium]
MASSSTEEQLDRHLAWLSLNAPLIPFLTLVEHLQRLRPEAPPVGGMGPVRAERIRFRHDPHLIFHSSDVAQMHVTPDGVAEITSTFLGATGSVSPLANFFTEDVLRAEGLDNGALASFYDLFHHRLLALCHRALSRNIPTATIRRAAPDTFTSRALALSGLLPKRPDAPLSSVAMLGRSRILARRPRGRAALQAAIDLGFAGWGIVVVDFFPRRVRLADDQRTRLGRCHHRLGHEARLGRHMDGQAGLVHLRVGPVNREKLDALMPGGKEHARLRALVDERAGGVLDVQLEVEMICGEEPRTVLGGRPPFGTRLGVMSLVRRLNPDRPVRVLIPLTEGIDDQRPAFLRDDDHRATASTQRPLGSTQKPLGQEPRRL